MGRLRTSAISAALIVAGVAAAASAAAAPARVANAGGIYLASLTGIQLGPHDFVDAFHIETWGVDFLAVCHLPPGWWIRAGKSAAPDGDLDGEGSHGVTWLNRPRLRELEGLALIQLDGPVQRDQRGSIPPTFRGHVQLGRYGTDERSRRMRLTAANIRLVPAARCPPPR